MKIYDISQELMSSAVYPGDPSPILSTLASIEDGDLYNLSSISACLHNGTHIDAPSHFLKGAKTVKDMDLSRLIGKAYVAQISGDIGGSEANDILNKASANDPEAAKRILLKGEATVTAEAAKEFLLRGVYLIGTETQSVGPINAPMEVHKLLLSDDVALLEGIVLKDVPEGAYFLFAAPINVGIAEGAPCRAVLIDFRK